MIIVAITGGIGSGKSEAARYFESKGAYVLDLDEIAKELLEPGTAVHDAVADWFGPVVLADDGSIDRAKLAEEAFPRPAAVNALNEMVHPAVVEDVDRRLQNLALQARPPRVVVIDVPLLAEARGLMPFVDKVVVVTAPEEMRLRRLEERGMSAQDARARMSRQTSDAERLSLADAVVQNDGNMEEFHAALERVWESEVEQRA